MQQSTSRYPPGSAGILNAYSAFPVSALCFRLFACPPLPVVAKHEVFGVLPCGGGVGYPAAEQSPGFGCTTVCSGISASGRGWGHAGDAGSNGEQRLARGWQLSAGRATEVSAKSSPSFPASPCSVGLHRGQETPQDSPLAVPAGWGSQDSGWVLGRAPLALLSARHMNTKSCCNRDRFGWDGKWGCLDPMQRADEHNFSLQFEWL